MKKANMSTHIQTLALLLRPHIPLAPSVDYYYTLGQNFDYKI